MNRRLVPPFAPLNFADLQSASSGVSPLERQRPQKAALIGLDRPPQAVCNPLSYGYHEFMSWLNVGLRLFREAVGTEAGRDIIKNVSSAMGGKPSSPEPTVDFEALLAEHQLEMSKHLQTIIKALNSQNDRLAVIVRRQRVWNIILAAGLLISVLITLGRS